MATRAAIQIEGLKETRRGLKAIGDGMGDLKAVHKRVGELVLKAARQRMPEDSGALKRSYKAGNIQGGAKVYSNLVYAGVSEFGGSIPRKGRRGQRGLGRGPVSYRRGDYLGRVKATGRTLHKPKASDVGLDSYYVYPAADEKKAEIERIYEEEIKALAKKYGLNK